MSRSTTRLTSFAAEGHGSVTPHAPLGWTGGLVEKRDTCAGCQFTSKSCRAEPCGAAYTAADDGATEGSRYKIDQVLQKTVLVDSGWWWSSELRQNTPQPWDNRAVWFASRVLDVWSQPLARHCSSAHALQLGSTLDGCRPPPPAPRAVPPSAGASVPACAKSCLSRGGLSPLLSSSSCRNEALSG